MAKGSAARRWEMAAVAAIVLLALGLRLYHLDAQSLWNDEGTSVALAQRDLATIARHASYDIHPPLYYLLLHGWVSLVGTSEVAVRSLSVMAGVALVAGVWALARRMVGPTAAALAALLTAAAPFQVYYSQEARMYIWAAFFGLLATIAYERLLSCEATLGPHRASSTHLPFSCAPSVVPSNPSVVPSNPSVVPSAARDLDMVGTTPVAGDGGAPGHPPLVVPSAPSVVPSAGRHAMARDLVSLGTTPSAGDGGAPHRAAYTILYALAAIAAIYCHYLGATVLVAHNLAFVAWWAWRWRAHRAGGRGAAWRALAGWALLQGLIVLAYMPWLAVSWRSLRNWPAVSADFAVAAMLGDALRAMVWGPAAEAGLSATVAAVAVAAMALPGLVWARGVGSPRRGASAEVDKVPRHGMARYARDDRGGARDEGIGATVRSPLRGPWPGWFGALLLALYLITPIAFMALASLGRPMYKTKFVLLATPPLYVLVAAGAVALGCWVARLSRRRMLGVVLTALLALGALAPAARGLARLYWDASTYRDDYRGIAAYIAATSGPDDAILINAPSQVETLGYYYRGPLPWYPLPRQRPIDAADTRAELEGIAARHDRVYAVLWATNESDPERVIEGWLDTHAFKAMDRWFGDVRLAMWAMPRSTEGAVVEPAEHVLGEQVRLRGYSILTPEPGEGDVLQVALHWEALAPMATRYKVFVHLVDAAGAIVAQRDSEPGGGARLTSDWAPGDSIIDLYGLLIPQGAPPGEHALRVGMYALDGGHRLPVTLEGQHTGDAIDLARVMVGEGE